MIRLFSLILLAVLSGAVALSLTAGTMARFFDTEVSTENRMQAATRNLELSGGPIVVPFGIPSKWYQQEYTLLNTGTVSGNAYVHLKNLVNVEDAPGAGVATTEPELVAEEGGLFGQYTVTGLGVDTNNIADHIDIKMWYDSDGDGTFDKLVFEGKLNTAESQKLLLGDIPAPPQQSNNNKGKGGGGGGWGSYFKYHISSPALELPLMAGQTTQVGTVMVSTEGDNLRVFYDTTSSGWYFMETHVYVATMPPPKLAPGTFPYSDAPLDPPVLQDEYLIPLSAINGGVVPSTDVFIAAHATGVDGETAWATGEGRRFKIELHLQQVMDPTTVDYDTDGDVDGDDAQLMWWPTNAYQGDYSTFDLEFILEESP